MRSLPKTALTLFALEDKNRPSPRPSPIGMGEGECEDRLGRAQFT
jgi:hypothetical protein